MFNKNLNDFDDKSSYDDLYESISRLGRLFAVPTTEELQACWELCRLHNNIGFWVVWLPTAWSIAMVYHAQTEITAITALSRAALYVPLCFGIKSLIMTIDDVLDYDVDALVDRTRNRAIPRGAISVQRAWLFFALQVVIGVYIANTTLRPTTMHMSMFAWPIYVLYPTCKRWMYFAPIPLGLMFKVGLFMGWSDLTVDGTIPWNVLTPMYIGASLWTISYETVYQHQDKLDDIKIGLYSPALFCREYTIPICTATAVGFLGLMSYGGALNNQGPAYFAGLAIAGYLLISKLLQTDVDVPEQCKELFLGTPLVGQTILGGLVVDVLAHRIQEGIAI